MSIIVSDMDDQNSDNDKKPWFGPKRSGFGNRPTTWQGKLVLAPLILVEVLVASIAPHLYPSWFKPKTVGIGFTPATWQGWLAVIGPGLLLLAIVGSINYKQRQK
jgi:hypothetical protein